MTLPEKTQDNRVWHVIALVCGLLPFVVLFGFANGIPGYLGVLAVAVVAVLLGHVAASRRGDFRAAAIVGLVLAYLGLILAVGLLLVRVTRLFLAG